MNLGVVIPVWKGEVMLPRCLEGLLVQRSLPGTVTVVVVVNDAELEAHAVARQVAELYANRMTTRGYAYHVVSSQPGRRAAFEAGETVLTAGARIYLDQDARLSTGALEQLAPLICNIGQACFATVSLRFTRSRSIFVRLVLETLCALPYFTASPVVAGCYAVSAKGRMLWDWDRMPAEVGDDKYVRLLFPPAARHFVKEESYEVVAPDSYRALIVARTRYARMNRALETLPSLYPNASRGEGVLRYLLWPGCWPGAALTALTLGLAFFGSRNRSG